MSVTACNLTTDQLRARAAAHRNMAKVKPGYEHDPKKPILDEMYETKQLQLASIYQELVEWRESNGE